MLRFAQTIHVLFRLAGFAIRANGALLCSAIQSSNSFNPTFSNPDKHSCLHGQSQISPHLTSQARQDVCRTPSVQCLPAAGILGVHKAGELLSDPLQRSVISAATETNMCFPTSLAFQSYHPRCSRWHWSAIDTFDETQPSRHRTRSLRYPGRSRSVGRMNTSCTTVP